MFRVSIFQILPLGEASRLVREGDLGQRLGAIKSGRLLRLLLFFALPIHAQTGRQTSNETCGKRNNSTFEGWSGGDQTALDELMPLVYDELHRLTHQHMRREQP